MYICPQKVDRKVHCMTDDENDRKSDGSYNSSAQHASHLINYGCDNTCRKAKASRREYDSTSLSHPVIL